LQQTNIKLGDREIKDTTGACGCAADSACPPVVGMAFSAMEPQVRALVERWDCGAQGMPSQHPP